MDHSLRTYLETIPIKRLEDFIRQYRRGEIQEDYETLLPTLEEALAWRKGLIPYPESLWQLGETEEEGD